MRGRAGKSVTSEDVEETERVDGGEGDVVSAWENRRRAVFAERMLPRRM